MRGLLKFPILMMLALGASCSDYWTIQRSESFVNERHKTRKIICLDPQISFQSQEKNHEYSRIQKLSEKLEKDIRKFSKRHQIEVEIRRLDKQADATYYTRLLALK